jgi:hypothetical protein
MPSTGIGAAVGDVHPLSPENLAQNFTKGLQAGAPMSAGAESLSHAISQGAQNAIHPQFTPQPEFSTPTGTLHAATAPSSAEIFSAQSHQTVTPVAAAQAPAMFSTPLAAAGPAVAAPTPIAPAGPLPAYGADLRPAMPTVIPPSALSASSPTSAPVNPASAAGGITQPAVVNKAPIAAASTSATSPSGLTDGHRRSSWSGIGSHCRQEATAPSRRSDRAPGTKAALGHFGAV